ncbi:MAG: hypothetical protein ABIH76_06250 [Candidatus Bathyarchaeota archaeon]
MKTHCELCGNRLFFGGYYFIPKLTEDGKYSYDEKGCKIDLTVCRGCSKKEKPKVNEAKEIAQNEQKQAKIEAKFIFKEDMTDEQLKELNKEHILALGEWEAKINLGTFVGGATYGFLSGNLTSLTLDMARLLQGIMEQNKIIIRQNELLLRKIENPTKL